MNSAEAFVMIKSGKSVSSKSGTFHPRTDESIYYIGICGNPNVSADIRGRFLCLEFLGSRFQRKNWKGEDRTWIRAKHQTTGLDFFYCFEEDFAWMPYHLWGVN
jgi:hypothetical protein